jgi:hypothetical protein
MAKVKSILLSYPHDNTHSVEGGANQHCYRVEKLGNNVEFNPGDFLLVAKVKDLCMAPGWDITIAKVR